MVFRSFVFAWVINSLVGYIVCADYMETKQNLDIKVHADAKLNEKYGHIFYNITEAQIDFNMNGLTLHLYNLFNGIKLLEDSTNAFLNENWKPVSDAFKPLIRKTIQDIVIGVINTIFNFVPAEYLISDIPHPSELYKESKTNNK